MSFIILSVICLYSVFNRNHISDYLLKYWNYYEENSRRESFRVHRCGNTHDYTEKTIFFVARKIRRRGKRI